MKGKGFLKLAQVFFILLFITIMLYQPVNETETIIYASRNIEPLDQCIEEADIVGEFEMKGVISEINTEDFPQSIHSAKMINTFKGNPGSTLKILQDGTTKNVFQDLPIFKKGEKYIFTLKSAKGSGLDDVYWATGVYYVDGEQAINIFSSYEPKENRTDLCTYDADHYSTKIEKKSN